MLHPDSIVLRNTPDGHRGTARIGTRHQFTVVQDGKELVLYTTGGEEYSRATLKAVQSNNANAPAYEATFVGRKSKVRAALWYRSRDDNGPAYYSGEFTVVAEKGTKNMPKKLV